MARKWSNLNLPGALHYVTGNFLDRIPVFTDPACCKAFLDELENLNRKWPSKLITYVLMPDHLHLIVNPRDGRIREFTGHLKAVSAKAIVQANSLFVFAETEKGHQVWQESFQRYGVMERMDDLAEDQLHPRQSGQGRLGQVRQRLLLVGLSIVLLTGR